MGNQSTHDFKGGSEYLSLDGKELTEIPIKSLLSLAPHLTSLDLNSNLLASNTISVPPSLSRLTNLRKLSLNHNRLTVLPLAVISLPSLNNLDVGHNLIKRLPDNLYDMKELMVFDVRNNPLTTLPGTISSPHSFPNVVLFRGFPFVAFLALCAHSNLEYYALVCVSLSQQNAHAQSRLCLCLGLSTRYFCCSAWC